MAAGTSLPADFTPDPQVVLPHVGKRFVERAIEVLGVLVGPPNSGAPITMINNPIFGARGHYVEQPYIKRVVTANRRDITSVSALTAEKFEGATNKAVRLSRRTPLVQFTDAVIIQGLSKEQLNAEFGRQLGEVIADDMINTIIAGLLGLTAAVTAGAHTHDIWNDTDKVNLTPGAISTAKNKMGDRYGMIKHMILRSEPMEDMRSHARAQGYDLVGGTSHRGDDDANFLGLARAVVDAADLLVADAGHDKVQSLLLGRNVAQIGFAEPVEIETDRTLLLENKASMARGDWGLWFACPVMGYNSGAGGKNPTNATLKSSSNWSVGYENHKELESVLIVHNAEAVS